MLPCAMALKMLKGVTVAELNEAYQKVLWWFFAFPTKEFGLSELAEAVRISKTTANIAVAKLVEQGFLKKEVLGKVWRLSCNQQHIYNYSRKISHNLMLVYESGIITEVKKAVQNPLAIVLFGSYRKGDDTEQSDIDIAVEILGDEEMKIVELGIVPQFGYRQNVQVNIHIFSRNKIDLNMFANITNGIVLDGFLEVRP